MSRKLARAVEVVAYYSGIPATKRTAHSAIDQHVKISRDDATERVMKLAKEFAEHIWTWPWQRCAELNEPSALSFPYLIWRRRPWPICGRLFDPSSFERRELGHVAAVVDRGEWFEP